MAESNDQHFVGKVAQKAIIEEAGKVLACRNVGAEKWDIPGGRLHKNETPRKGLERELFEELGVGVVIGDLYEVGVYLSKDTTINSMGDPHYFVAFTGTLAEPEQKFVLELDEIAEIKWITEKELESLPMHFHYKEMLKRYFSRV